MTELAQAGFGLCLAACIIFAVVFIVAGGSFNLLSAIFTGAIALGIFLTTRRR